MLAISYGITALLFLTMFNFSDFASAPFYRSALDPHGPFVSWIPMTFTMTTVGVLLTLLYFDLLPISLIAKRVPALGGQPWFGLLTIAFSTANFLFALFALRDKCHLFAVGLGDAQPDFAAGGDGRAPLQSKARDRLPRISSCVRR